MLTLPVIFQCGEGEKFTNFGHPRLLRVPNCVTYARLHALVDQLAPGTGIFTNLTFLTNKSYPNKSGADIFPS